MKYLYESFFDQREIGGMQVFCSKFLNPAFRLPLLEVTENWSQMAADARHGLAQAISLRDEPTVEDEAIAFFIVQDRELVSSIAPIFPRLADRKRAIEELHRALEINAAPLERLNVLQAIEEMGSTSSIQPLENSLTLFKQLCDRDGRYYREYFATAHALWRLTGGAIYRAEIQRHLQHTDRDVQKAAHEYES